MIPLDQMRREIVEKLAELLSMPGPWLNPQGVDGTPFILDKLQNDLAYITNDEPPPHPGEIRAQETISWIGSTARFSR